MVRNWQILVRLFWWKWWAWMVLWIFIFAVSNSASTNSVNSCDNDGINTLMVISLVFVTIQSKICRFAFKVARKQRIGSLETNQNLVQTAFLWKMNIFTNIKICLSSFTCVLDLLVNHSSNQTTQCATRQYTVSFLLLFLSAGMWATERWSQSLGQWWTVNMYLIVGACLVYNWRRTLSCNLIRNYGCNILLVCKHAPKLKTCYVEAD